MTESIFIRALDAEDKESRLSDAVSCLINGEAHSAVFLPEAKVFNDIPGTPIAYWISDSFRTVFSKSPCFGEDCRSARVGLQTSDDFRFVRLIWETDPASIGGTWFPFAKGGEYNPFYTDIHLHVNWGNSGEELRNYYDPGSGRLRSRPQNTEYYLRKGLTWPERTTSGFSPQVLPGNSIISQVGLGMYLQSESEALAWLAVLNTRVYQYFAELLIGLGEETVSGSAGRHYTSGVVSKLPFPVELLSNFREILSNQSWRQVCASREQFLFEETCPLYRTFRLSSASSIASLTSLKKESFLKNAESALRASEACERLVREQLALSQADIEDIVSIVGPHPVVDLSESDLKTAIQVLEIHNNKTLEETIDDAVSDGFANRSVTKKSFFVSRIHEILAQIGNVSAITIVAADGNRSPNKSEALAQADSVISFAAGCVFGRWDIRYATGERQPSELPDPFDPLPVCPPGMLQNAEGLPAEAKDVPADYPLRISWPGILVDDENHPEDIVARVREAIEVIWKDRAEAIEQEACGILGVKTLRDYLRRPAAFFADHLKRYSKSRRQAPIYWPLSTASGSYTLWIYYHRLTDQTLHSAIADFLDPKIKATGKAIDEARNKKRGAEVSELSDLLDELNQFREELERVIKLPWKPNLNDGVLITACPFWRLFRHGKWHKDLKACWEALSEGEYDWAHLAYSIWPERVRDKCKADRSLAIAHNLEELCKESDQPKNAKKPKKK